MKKIILILLLVIPIVITVLAYLISGFVGRALMQIGLRDIIVDEQAAIANGLFWNEAAGIWATTMRVGVPLDMNNFLSPYPSEANRIDLIFEIQDDTGAVISIVTDAGHVESDYLTITNWVLQAKETRIRSIWVHAEIGGQSRFTLEILRIDAGL